MKILVIGGMHGNEPTGVQLVELLKRKPIRNVQAVLANESAIRANKRFVKNDMNRSFPGSLTSAGYEAKRAAELLALTKSYDLVLDFHNTHCPDNDCGFVGDSALAGTYDAAAWLGLHRIIVADYNCLNKYAPNCLSVEISLSSPKMDIRRWYKQIAQMAKLNQLPPAKDIEKYRFVYRMTLDDRNRLKLPVKNFKAFQPIPSKLAQQMGVRSPAYPIFIGDGYTPYNYGGLLNRLS